VFANRLSAGGLTAFIFYAVIVANATFVLAEVYGELQRAAGASERLLELLGTTSHIKPPLHPVALPQPGSGAVAFDDVTFFYPSRPQAPALERFSLAVKPGEAVALVGPSGAGKTTVFQLLLRFYDPATGSVSIDGVDARTADPRELRRRVAVVAQDPVIFATTVMENVRYGRPEAGDDEVREALAAAFALDFVERLSDGVNTPLGERGVKLSGGQAPAHRDRTGDPRRPLGAAARRGHERPRRREREGGAARARAADAGPHHACHRPSPRDR
jgi:ATP-binding cassette subfamily B protein